MEMEMARTEEIGAELVAAAKNAKEKAAAELFKSAEDLLMHHDVLDKIEESVGLSKKALDAYAALGDAGREADAVRLVVKTHIAQADLLRVSESDSQREAVKGVLKAAEAMTKEHMAKFRGKGEKKCEAAMMLSFAEVNHNKRGQQKREEAQQMVYSALRLAEELKDKALEAKCHHIMTVIFQKNRLVYEALEEGEKTVELFQQLGQRRMEAKALHQLAFSRFALEDLSGALDAAQDALDIFLELGDKRLAAFENLTLARFLLGKGRCSQALSYATDSVELYTEVGQASSSALAAAYAAVVQASIGCNRTEEASAVAEESLQAAESVGDRRGQVQSLSALVQASIAKHNLDDALQHAEEAVGLCMDMKDRKWEGHLLNQIAKVQLAKKDLSSARNSAEDALAIAKDLVDKQDEGICLQILAEVANAERDFNTVLEYNEEQRNLYRDLGDKPKEATALLNVANSIAVVKQDITQAMDMAEEAKAMYQEACSVRGEAMALQNLANWYTLRKDYEEAVAAATEARQLLKGVDFRLESKAAGVLVNIYNSFKEHNKAAKAAQDAYMTAKKSKDKYLEIDTLLVNSTCQLELAYMDQKSQENAAKHIGRAEKLAKEAYTIAKKLRNNEFMGISMLAQARVMTAYGSMSEAMKTINEAMDIFKKIGNESLVNTATLSLASAYYASDENERALDLAREGLEKAKQLGDAANVEAAEGLIEKIEGPKVVAPVAGAATAASTDVVAAAAAGEAGDGEGKVQLSEEMVRATVMDMLKSSVGTEEAVEGDTPFMDTGMDSLTAVSFRSGLQQQLGVKLPASLVFDYPSINEVSKRIAELANEEE